jgi:hypothetical protein
LTRPRRRCGSGVKQPERDAGTRHERNLTSSERRELAELRRENRRLREDVDILSASPELDVLHAAHGPPARLLSGTESAIGSRAT